MDMQTEDAGGARSGPIVAGTILLALGTVMLLNSSGVIDVHVGRLIGPLVLIAIGSCIVLGQSAVVVGTRESTVDGSRRRRRLGQDQRDHRRRGDGARESNQGVQLQGGFHGHGVPFMVRLRSPHRPRPRFPVNAARTAVNDAVRLQFTPSHAQIPQMVGAPAGRGGARALQRARCDRRRALWRGTPVAAGA